MKNSQLKILLVPLVIILMISSSVSFMLFFGYKNLAEISPYMPISKIILIIAHSSTLVAVYYFAVEFFNKRLPWNKRWVCRLLVDISIILLMAFIGIWLMLYFENHHIFPLGIGSGNKEILYIIPLMMNSLYLVIIETIQGIDERNKLIDKLNRLEQLHLKSKYGALKNQLDHHFLFNNLSTLSSIIYEDVDKADKFIQGFSRVYRYVLSINKHDLVALHEEIDFIKSYLQLYKCRFEDGFDYEINIDSDKLNMLIAPLTLQVLIENAIKHNMVSRNQPLCIKIFNDNNGLIVKNNLQKRDDSDIDSTHTGQSNINEKYELLNYPLPEIKDNGEFYSVKISLIPHNHG